MRIVGNTYVLSAAIALVAMVSRAGWINWPEVGHFVAVLVAMAAGVFIFVALIALVIGLPLVILGAIAEELLKLVSVKPTGEPPA